MVIAGIILLVVGFAIAWLSKEAGEPRFRSLGFIVAVVGVVLIVLGAILAAADGSDAELGGVIGAPFGLGLIRGRIKMSRPRVLTPVGTRR